MNNKEKYRLFCEVEVDMPIFSKNWWLDSVCGEDGWEVLILEKGGDIIASMPYQIKKKGGFLIIEMPMLTQALGPYIKYPKGQSYYKKLSFEKEIMCKFEEKLPKIDFFSQMFHYKVTNWLPFFWKGYSQTTRYTYIIENLQSLEEVSKILTSSYRNKIKKALKEVKVKRGLNIVDFYKINEKTFKRQDIDIPYSLSFLKQHDEYLIKHDCREIFYAIDLNQKIHSALYLTWDAKSAYVHMVGEDPDFRKSGAGILLIKEAITFAKENLKVDSFDFEGSMIESVEQVRRSFGAVQKPYFHIYKTTSKLLTTISFLKKILK